MRLQSQGWSTPVLHVLRRENEREGEERSEQHDRVQRPLELAAERPQVQGAGAGVELEENGVSGLRLDEGPAEQRERDEIGELGARRVPHDAARPVVERRYARVGSPGERPAHELVLHAGRLVELRLAGTADALDARDEGCVDVRTREHGADGTRVCAAGAGKQRGER